MIYNTNSIVQRPNFFVTCHFNKSRYGSLDGVSHSGLFNISSQPERLNEKTRRNMRCDSLDSIEI